MQTGSSKAERKCSCPGLAPFIVGVVGALVVGWWLFPKALYSVETQPIRFSHVVHVEESGMECADCHYLREDGSFHGVPTTEECAECHAEPMGEDPEEIKFVKQYVEPGKEVPWLIHQYQPDNVFFSHAVHSQENCGQCHDFEGNEMCVQCHPNVAESDGSLKVKKNLLTEYTPETMKMWACEECHAIPEHMDINETYNNACFVCHK